MNGNIDIHPKLRWFPVAALAANNTFTVLSGAAGWIDTDISASDVPSGATSINFYIYSVSGGSTGGRQHGSAIEPLTPNMGSLFRSFVCSQDNTRHVDLYRNALGDLVYYIFGYTL